MWSTESSVVHSHCGILKSWWGWRFPPKQDQDSWDWNLIHLDQLQRLNYDPDFLSHICGCWWFVTGNRCKQTQIHMCVVCHAVKQTTMAGNKVHQNLCMLDFVEKQVHVHFMTWRHGDIVLGIFEENWPIYEKACRHATLILFMFVRSIPNYISICPFNFTHHPPQ